MVDHRGRLAGRTGVLRVYDDGGGGGGPLLPMGLPTEPKKAAARGGSGAQGATSKPGGAPMLKRANSGAHNEEFEANPLADEDGCVGTLFHYLWRRNSLGHTCEGLNIPDTVRACAFTW